MYLKPTPGIYIIRNKINSMLYIGSSVDCDRRLKQHFSNLLENKHINKHLQNAYNKYGREHFTSEVTLVINRPNGIDTKTFQKDYLFPKETEIIQSYNTINLYNKMLYGLGYTNQMNTQDALDKSISTRKSKKKKFYVYNHFGDIINIALLTSDINDSFIYKYIDDGTIHNGYYYSYNNKLKQDNIAEIYINWLVSSWQSRYINLYEYFNINYDTSKFTGRISKSIIGYNRNGDKFEFKSTKEASQYFSISENCITEAINRRIRIYKNTKNINYLCKSISWGYDGWTLTDSINTFRLYDEQEIKLKEKKTRSIKCSKDGIDLIFSSIKIAKEYFNLKSGAINNVLCGKNKTFNNGWICVYLN